MMATMYVPQNEFRIRSSTIRSAIAFWSFQSCPGPRPARYASRTFLPQAIAQSKIAFFAPPSFSAFAVAAV